MKLSKLVVLFGLALTASLAVAGESPSATRPSILPKEFGGWDVSGTVRHSHDAAVADPVNAALLKEYGFTDFESASYTRDDGRKLTLRAARFHDASGAYGAFTYYRTPAMPSEEIGDQGASLNERVLFYRGNVLVDAVFEKLSAMSAAELRELSRSLPLPPGSEQNLATFLAYLPRTDSAKYVIGPIGLEKINAPLPEELVDFSTGTEVALGTYRTSRGQATMMLLEYPTPQIAADRLRRITAAEAQNSKQPGSVPALGQGPLFSKRTGPLVVVVAGTDSQSEAQALLASVNYDANVTWNERDPFDKKNNIGNIVWNALVLCGILMALALVAGLAFGGVRVLLKRVLPNRIFDRPQAEFISLHLDETGPSRSRPR
jgi:Family of unknown function (DUF6599)